MDEELELKYYTGPRYKERTVLPDDPLFEATLRRLVKLVDEIKRLKTIDRKADATSIDKELRSNWGKQVGDLLETEVNPDLANEFKKMLHRSISWPIAAERHFSDERPYRQEQLAEKSKDLDAFIRNKIISKVTNSTIPMIRQEPFSPEELHRLEEECKNKDPGVIAARALEKETELSIQNAKADVELQELNTKKNEQWMQIRIGVCLFVPFVFILANGFSPAMSGYNISMIVWGTLTLGCYMLSGIRDLIQGSHFPGFTEILFLGVLLCFGITAGFWSLMLSNLGLIVGPIGCTCLVGVIYLNLPQQRIPKLPRK